jgi:hypothetical protein
MGIDFRSPAAGCCGMAGAFGFEREKYDVSLAVGELELLPAVRAASPECLIIADGFSCREQIAQCTDRHALHLGEVIQMALHETPGLVAGAYPERHRVVRRQVEIDRSMTRAGVGLAAVTAGALALWALTKRR